MRKHDLLSKRADTIKGLPMYALVDEARILESKGKRIFHLEIGSTTGYRNEHIHRIIAQCAAQPSVGYCPSGGTFELRERIAASYSRETGAAFGIENVAIAPANAAITQVQAVTTDPGDSVLLPDPGFPTYRLGALYNGLSILNYKLDPEKQWNPSVSDVERLLDSGNRVRMIFLNSPSNPLGSVMDKQTANEILRLAWQRRVVAVVDETYKNLIFEGEHSALDHYETNVYLYSFSKDAAVPGLRIGSVVGHADVVGKVNEFSSMFLSCLPPMFQEVISKYLDEGPTFSKFMRDDMRERVSRVSATLAKAPRLSFVTPKAAFYLFISIADMGMSSDEFSLKLLRETGVCVCPGSSFGPSGKDHVRITLSVPEEDLYEACSRLVSFLAC